MVDTVTFTLTGFEGVRAKLAAVSYDVKRKGGRSALRKAAQVVANNIKAKAREIDDPETARSIEDNVAIRWNKRRFKATGDLAFKIGILGGANVRRNLGPDVAGAPTPHWRMLEFGTENMAARPFVRPALAENIDEVTSTFAQAYEKALDKAIASALAGAGQ